MIAAGQQVGPFTIVEKIGRGGMASVYKAYETGLDRHVALKILPHELLEQSGFSDRFAREARLIARLEHPNIVPVYAFGIDADVPWMALRLVLGGHLGERFDASPLPIDAGLRYFRMIADGLDHAHAHAVVHRDLKPQNVLLGERGELYLADFGIARLLEAGTALTQTGAALGTPQYMAPEQAKGEDVGPPADIYALGVMAYRWLGGTLPFDADTPYAVMYKQVTSPLPLEPLSALAEDARVAIEKALAKNPAERWSSATDFIDALAHGLYATAAPIVTEAAPVAIVPTPGRTARGPEAAPSASPSPRARTLGIAAAIAFALVASTGALYAWLAHDDAPAQATTSTRMPTPAAAQGRTEAIPPPAAPTVRDPTMSGAAQAEMRLGETIVVDEPAMPSVSAAPDAELAVSGSAATVVPGRTFENVPGTSGPKAGAANSSAGSACATDFFRYRSARMEGTLAGKPISLEWRRSSRDQGVITLTSSGVPAPVTYACRDGNVFSAGNTDPALTLQSLAVGATTPSGSYRVLTRGPTTIGGATVETALVLQKTPAGTSRLRMLVGAPILLEDSAAGWTTQRLTVTE